jgi:hypothetical protein
MLIYEWPPKKINFWNVDILNQHHENQCTTLWKVISLKEKGYFCDKLVL